MGKPRISYVDAREVTDPRMLEEFERAGREGTPRVESHAIRAHVPAVFWSFVNTCTATSRSQSWSSWATSTAPRWGSSASFAR
jgi:hypothetical protein